MRKRNINHLADTLFWYILYILPVFLYVLYIFAMPSTSTSVVNFSDFLNTVGINLHSDNIVLTVLTEILGSNGILPLFANQTPLIIFSWFVSVFLCHLLVDVLLFIPRLFHKYEKSLTQGE